MKPRLTMCDNCPFGQTAKQRKLRNGLRPGRMDDIKFSVLLGGIFPCHKTTEFNDEDEWVMTKRDRECAGSIAFREGFFEKQGEEKRAGQTKVQTRRRASQVRSLDGNRSKRVQRTGE